MSVGALLLAAALALTPARAGAQAVTVVAQTPAATALPDGGFVEGAQGIRTLLLHFAPESAADLFPVWRDLAAALPATTEIVLAAPDGTEAAAEALLASTGSGRRPFQVIGLPGQTTVWARDRVVVVRRHDRYLLLGPDSEYVQGDRKGDTWVAEGWAAAVEGSEAVATPLVFEGGNVLFGERRVFVGLAMFEDNPELELDVLGDLFGAKPLMLGQREGVLHEHLDMFLTTLGRRTVLLGDPGRGAAVLEKLARDGLEFAMPDTDSWAVEPLQELATVADGIAAELEAAGYRVVRIPWVRGEGGTVFTWNNALTEHAADGRRAYVPVYGVPWMDREALRAYEREGFRAFPIDVSRIAPFGGTVRCLTNVLRWELPGAAPPEVRPR